MVKEFTGFMRGINFGLWLAQFPNNDAGNKKHFDEYNTERDFEFVSKFGYDHVRLPIDYALFDPDANVGFGYIDRVISWCKKYKLNLILDLHRTFGFSFDTLETNTFFTSAELQEKFYGLWETIARKYKGEKLNMCFELLNEITDNHGAWNRVTGECVDRIRKIDKTRKIIIGSNHYNEAKYLCDLVTLNDPNIIYTFHCYTPHLFTHQRAPWSNWRDIKEQIKYPSRDASIKMLGEPIEIAATWAREKGVSVYCGEFGVCQFADNESAVRWYTDLLGLFEKHGIGHAVWNYKEAMFRLENFQTGEPNLTLFTLFARKM
jgi:aryl-phospho-beta-D-glucosidase BglC (GH1 family)